MSLAFNDFEAAVERYARPATKTERSSVAFVELLFAAASAFGFVELRRQSDDNRVDVTAGACSFSVFPVPSIFGSTIGRLAKLVSEITNEPFSHFRCDKRITLRVEEIVGEFRVAFNHYEAPIFVRIESLGVAAS